MSGSYFYTLSLISQIYAYAFPLLPFLLFLIQLRKIGVDENGNPYPVVDYEVSGEEITVVEMIPGYTHNLINLSDTEDLVTLMWANEPFDPEHPDTFAEPV